MKKLAHDPVFAVEINKIYPSPENALLYHPVTPDDPATIELADSIREHGILEPIVIGEDGYIISGHRRHCAGRMAGLNEVPCRKMRGVRRGDGEKADDGFLRLLREHNRSRIKRRDELLREAIISVDPDKAHRALTAYRRRKSKISISPIEVREVGRRCEISEAKTEFLRGVQGIIRDLLQSQPNQIELVVEKNTLRNIVSPVAAEFCIPLTIGRGQCLTRPLYNISERYKKSGKAKLVILAVSDLDPDGDAIAHSLGERLRDDFGVRDVAVIKTALTMEQVGALALPEKFERAKEKSPNYLRYLNTYRTDFVWELEAVDPKTLQKLITDAIDSVIDRKAYNAEVTQERADAAHNAGVRQIVLQTLREQTGS